MMFATLTFSQIIELIKVLSPTVVAGAVLVVTVRQNLWMRDHAKRQLRNDIITRQVKLLEERQKIIRVVGSVLARYSYDHRGVDDRNDNLFTVLVDGRTVFSEAISQKLNDAWLKQVALNDLRKPLVQAVGFPRTKQLDDLQEQANQAREDIFIEIQQLYESMIAATRYDEVDIVR